MLSPNVILAYIKSKMRWFENRGYANAAQYSAYADIYDFITDNLNTPDSEEHDSDQEEGEV